MGAAQHSCKLPKAAVPSPSLEVFKIRLEKALSNLVCRLSCFGQQAGPETPEVPTAQLTVLK